MEIIILTLGTFRAILDYCTRETTSIEELSFADLLEKRVRVYFRSFDQAGNPKIRTSLQRIGSEVRQPMDCQEYYGSPTDSPETRGLALKQRREYEPPRFLYR
jgi:hypothetical protein